MMTKHFTQEELQTIIDQMEFMKKSPLKQTSTTKIHLGDSTYAEISTQKEARVTVRFTTVESSNYYDR